MRLYRWVREEDGAMVLSSRVVGARRLKRLGRVAEVEGGFLWETADGMWGAVEPTLGAAMAYLERRAMRR